MTFCAPISGDFVRALAEKTRLQFDPHMAMQLAALILLRQIMTRASAMALSSKFPAQCLRA